MIKISVLLVALMQDFSFFLLLLEAIALTGNVATEPVRVGGVCLHFFFFFSFNMGLNHYIGSLLNYRLLILSQHHHAIFEALLCSGERFCLFFLGRCASCVLYLSKAICSENHLTFIRLAHLTLIQTHRNTNKKSNLL